MLKVTIPDASILFDKKNLRVALREAAKLVAQEARSMTRNAGGSGRAYATPSSMAKGVHYASAPGEPPASLTGTLSRSISYSVKGDRATIYDRVFYAKFLEGGAKGGGKKGSLAERSRIGTSRSKRNPKSKKNQTPSTRRVLEPRPYISTALAKNESLIERKIIEAVKADMQLVKVT